MNNFKSTPPSMRYLGARLKPFRRPLFWGSLGLTSLIGLALYQYWHHPDWLNSNLSEIDTTHNSSANKLSNLAKEQQISAEDLAVGADLDNLDVLLKELEQNQTVPIGQTVNPQKSNNSLQTDSKNTIYHRFQEKQKSKLNRSPKPLIPNQNKPNNLATSPTRDIFKLSNFGSYNPTNPTSQNSTSSTPGVIPNPVGRLYLSDRDRLNNTIVRPNITPGSVNSFSNINTVPTTTETTETNLSAQNNSNLPTSEIRVNPGETTNYVTPVPIPYNNNLNATPITPRPSYGQPIYQQPTNAGVNTNVVGNQSVNVSPTRFEPGNLSNQEQTQRYYQLNPSNYQLQPRGYNQPNVNNGFTSQPNNGFNSQPNAFSSSGSFGNSQFNGNQ